MRKTFKELMGATTYNEGKDLVLRAEGENLMLQMVDGTNILKFGEKSYNENKGIAYLLEKTKFNLEKEEHEDDDVEKLFNAFMSALEKRGDNKDTKNIIKKMNSFKDLMKIDREIEAINNIKDEKEKVKASIIFGYKHKDMLPNSMREKIKDIENTYIFHKTCVEDISFEDFVELLINIGAIGIGDE